MQLFDHNFFSTPGQINSYWAGFIAADGCINTGSNRIQIVTHYNDIDHLRQLLTITNCPNKITINKDNSVKVGITSKQWQNDLRENYSIIPRKSLILGPPGIKGRQAIKAYIAGYIDGDGSIGYKRNKYWSYLTINIVGTKQLLTWINDSVSVPGTISPKENVFRLDWSNRKAFDIYNELWNPRLPILDRKWNKTYKIWNAA